VSQLSVSITAATIFMIACGNSDRVGNTVTVKADANNTITIPETSINTTIEDVKKTRNEMLSALIAVMKSENDEHIPFDEPLHEYGFQLDGKLRPLWINAYRHRERKFGFNGDWYRTWTSKGAPNVPQVCADFIVDSIDRTAGTWYSLDRNHPQRVIGRYDFRTDIKSHGLDPRRIPDLVSFFETHNEWFQFVYKKETTDSSPPVGQTKNLTKWLHEHGTALGDILFIRGKAPWDYEKEIHWHSLIVSEVDENDKVTKVFGNPSYAIERSISGEMGRAPKRTVSYIIRLKNEFLNKINP